MRTIPNINPFNYGFGSKPAYFAGRKEEINKIFSYLNSITADTDEKGRLPMGTKTPFMIIGPRGVGKTALLNKALIQAKQLGIQCYSLIKKDFTEGFGVLVETLSKKNTSSIEEHLSEININLTEIINTKVKPGRSDTILEHIFEINLKKAPMLLICDEAHKYNNKEFDDFINFLRTLIIRSYPIALLIAGIPKVSRITGNIDTSYIDRIKFMYLNQLNQEDSIEAIKVPFTEYNIEFATGVLDLLVSAADHYPYFLQLIGSKLWEIVYMSNLTLIDITSANNAIENSKIEREGFYSRRKEEIGNSVNRDVLIGILQHVREKNDETELFALQDFVKETYKDVNYIEVINLLKDLGILWSVGDRISPGIPSFLNYILRSGKE